METWKLCNFQSARPVLSWNLGRLLSHIATKTPQVEVSEARRLCLDVEWWIVPKKETLM